MNLLEVKKMEMAQLEIHKAVRMVQSGPTIVRQVCIICKHPLHKWDIQKGKATCLYCRKKYWPEPKAPEKEETNHNVCPLMAACNRKKADLEEKVSWQPKRVSLFTKKYSPWHYKSKPIYRTREPRKHFMDTKFQYIKPMHYRH